MTPKAIDILLDISGSMGTPKDAMPYVRIVKHLNEIIRPGIDPTFAVGLCVFGGAGVKRVLPIRPRPTDELGDSINGITKQHSPFGTTPLADAISLSCDDIARVPAKSRAILVLSDGGENGSKIQLSVACTKAREMSVDIEHGGLSVFGIGIDSLDKELRKLSEDTKGKPLVIEAKAPEGETKAKLQDFMLEVATRDVPAEITARLTIAVEIDRALSRHRALLLNEIKKSLPHSPVSPTVPSLEARLDAINQNFTNLKSTLEGVRSPAPRLSQVWRWPRRLAVIAMIATLVLAFISTLLSIVVKQNSLLSLLSEVIELLRQIKDQLPRR